MLTTKCRPPTENNNFLNEIGACVGLAWGLEGQACVKPQQKMELGIMCYSTKLAVNFAKLLSFLKRGATNCDVKTLIMKNVHENWV